MKYGVSTACFYPMLTEEALTQIGKHGVKNAEVFFDTFSELERNYLKELRNIADSYGTKIVSAHPFTCAFEPFLFFTNYERRFRDALELYRHYFEAMNLLGAEIFVFHGDREAGKTENHDYFERFALLQKLGKEYGVIVAQENVERCKSRSVAFLSEMADYLDSGLSIVFDNKQAVRSGVDYRTFIEQLGSYIVHVHVSDHNMTCDCLPIGAGKLDLPLFLSLLEEKSNQSCLIVELYNDLIADNCAIFQSYDNLQLF